MSAHIGQYERKLYTADPGNSEIISQLSNLFSRFVYLIAIFAAAFVFFTGFIGLLTHYIVLSILLFWIPLIVIFVVYQSSLSNIVRRSKWKTLNRIQAMVEELQETKNFGDKETMDAINRLMDFHNRVNATRNSTVDLRIVLNFVNSLLLPILAFLLGNFDLILGLFVKKP